MIRTLLIAALLLTRVLTAEAGDVRLYGEKDRVDPKEVARILGGTQSGEPIRYRSIRMLDDQKSPAAAETARSPASALALPIKFAFDSAEILPAARAQLDALADGVRLLDADRKVTIEGHTDAKGSEQYNLELSRRRAQAVKNYLVTVQGIDPARLAAIGIGEGQPFDGSDPMSAQNRRVQFRGN